VRAVLEVDPGVIHRDRDVALDRDPRRAQDVSAARLEIALVPFAVDEAAHGGAAGVGSDAAGVVDAVRRPELADRLGALAVHRRDRTWR